MSNQHKIALTITNLGVSHTNGRGTKTTATVCYVNEMSSTRQLEVQTWIFSDYGLSKVEKYPFTSVVERASSIVWVLALMSKNLSKQNGSKENGSSSRRNDSKLLLV